MITGNELSVDEFNALLAENEELRKTVLELRERILDLERDLENALVDDSSLDMDDLYR